MTPQPPIPDGAIDTLTWLRLGVFVLVPAFTILYTWTENLKPRGVGLIPCARAIIKRATLYIVGLGVIGMLLSAVSHSQISLVLGIYNSADKKMWLPLQLLLLAFSGGLYGAIWYYAAQSVCKKLTQRSAASTTANSGDYLRGAQVVDGSGRLQAAAEWRAKFEASPEKQAGHYVSSVQLGGLWMPRADERRHAMIIGASGSGKSVLFRGMFHSIREREKFTGERGFVLDPDGGYTSRFYRTEIDTILNPYDARTVQWSLFGDIRQPWDVDHIAAALVPGNDKWDQMARQLCASAIEVLRKMPGAKAKDIYELCVLATPQEQAELLKGTPAARYFIEGNERARESIVTTVTDCLAPLRVLSGEDSFSITDWIQQGKGWLFLPYSADQIASLKALYSIWSRVGIFSALSLPEIEDNDPTRIWFSIDEFDALGKINGMSDALARLRKHGAAVLMGLQSIGMVDMLYGQGYADAISENCGSRVIMRCSSGKSNGGGTSVFASKLIGQRQIRRIVTNVSTSRGSGWSRGGLSSNRNTSTSQSEQIATEDAVMPAEIEQLPIGKGYIKFASEPQWQLVQFPNDSTPATVEAFIDCNQPQETGAIK